MLYDKISYLNLRCIRVIQVLPYVNFPKNPSSRQDLNISDCQGEMSSCAQGSSEGGVVNTSASPHIPVPVPCSIPTYSEAWKFNLAAAFQRQWLFGVMCHIPNVVHQKQS